MSMSDPIADMLTRIRNAILRKHDAVEVPASIIKESLAKVLLQEGFVAGVQTEPAAVGSSLKIQLKYDAKGNSVIREIKRVSRPGLRVHKGCNELHPSLGGQGIFILSTSKGVLSDGECKKQNIGGEVLCEVF